MDTIKQRIIIASGLVLNDKGEILIAKRVNTADIPDSNDRWDFVGGKIEWGELPEEAVIREVKEESGLDVEIDSLLTPRRS